MNKIFRFTFENNEGVKHYEIYTEQEMVSNLFNNTIAQYQEDGYTLVKACEQYIGINDKNDALIIENDKVRFFNPKFNKYQNGVIGFNNGSFCIKCGNSILYKIIDFKDIEVLIEGESI